MIDVTETLDVTGLACPMPVVNTKLAIDKLPAGAVLRVAATDRCALSDIPAWGKGYGAHAARGARRGEAARVPRSAGLNG